MAPKPFYASAAGVVNNHREKPVLPVPGTAYT
jgi:hypothetical protein